MTLLTLGCVSDPAPDPDPEPEPTVRLDRAKLGSVTSLRVGEFAALDLTSNPSTGFQWTQSIDDDPEGVLAVEGLYRSDPNPEGETGVGGQTRYYFRAKKVGKAKVTLTHSRGDGSDPAHVLELAFEVRE